jgi:hypothetical protein
MVNVLSPYGKRKKLIGVSVPETKLTEIWAKNCIIKVFNTTFILCHAEFESRKR